MKKLFALTLALLVGTLVVAEDKKGDATKADKTIAETCKADKNFSTLCDAVKAAGLVETLSGGEYTVFAPTNSAFEAIPKDKLEALMKDKEKLATVLKGHVVKGSVMSSDLKDGQEVETLDGSKYKVSIKDKEVMIGNAKVTKADVKASNGVIHVIDGVLMPSKK